MTSKVQLLKETLQYERENIRAFSIAELTAPAEKADQIQKLKDDATARVKELTAELEGMIDEDETSEITDGTNTNSKENRAVALLTTALKNVPVFSHDVNTTEWCDNITKLQSIHAGESESDEVKTSFYKSVSGLINTVSYNSWMEELERTNKPGTTADLLIFLQEHYGDKTSIYQCLSTLWSMKKEPTSSYTQTAHLMEHKLAHAMATIKKTYQRINKSELTVDSFSKIVAGMVYSELARTADPEIFRHATKDLEECFSPSEIASKLQYYKDQFGSSDAVTTAEKASANVFYGANPKVANAKAKYGKKGSNGGRRRRNGNTSTSRQDKNHGKGDKVRSNDRCQFQDFKNGCTRSNCPYRHDGGTTGRSNSGNGGHRGSVGNTGHGSHVDHVTHGGAVGNGTYHTQLQSMPVQSITATPAMMSYSQPITTATTASMVSNGPDADFRLC